MNIIKTLGLHAQNIVAEYGENHCLLTIILVIGINYNHFLCYLLQFLFFVTHILYYYLRKSQPCYKYYLKYKYK